MTEPEVATSPVRKRMGCLLHSWLGVMSISSGIAVAILALVALPIAQAGWEKAGVDLPESVMWMVENRVWIAVVGIGSAVISTLALVRMKRHPLLRYLVHTMFAIVPMVIAVFGIFAWWMVYAAMLRQQME